MLVLPPKIKQDACEKYFYFLETTKISLKLFIWTQQELSLLIHIHISIASGE